jgi:hypothetical protein
MMSAIAPIEGGEQMDPHQIAEDFEHFECRNVIVESINDW